MVNKINEEKKFMIERYTQEQQYIVRQYQKELDEQESKEITSLQMKNDIYKNYENFQPKPVFTIRNQPEKTIFPQQPVVWPSATTCCFTDTYSEALN